MSADNHLQPQQLKMFMSAREITDTYAPHEGDRLARGANGEGEIGLSWSEASRLRPDRLGVYIGHQDGRAGNSTQRSHRTDGVPNERYSPEAVGSSDAPYFRPYKRIAGKIRPETDTEMWSRKARESRSRGYVESIASKGVIQPIPLSNRISPTSGRPMVAGGQHRIATAMQIDPDRLMPVLHHENINTAQSDPVYRYT